MLSQHSPHRARTTLSPKRHTHCLFFEKTLLFKPIRLLHFHHRIRTAFLPFSRTRCLFFRKSNVSFIQHILDIFKRRVFASRARIRALSSFFRIFPIFWKTHTESHLPPKNSHRCRHFAYKPHLFMPHLKKAKKEQEYKVNHYHIAWCP